MPAHARVIVARTSSFGPRDWRDPYDAGDLSSMVGGTATRTNPMAAYRFH